MRYPQTFAPPAETRIKTRFLYLPKLLLLPYNRKKGSRWQWRWLERTSWTISPSGLQEWAAE